MKTTISILVIVLVLGVGWYLLSPLFISTTVNEEFPESVSEEAQETQENSINESADSENQEEERPSSEAAAGESMQSETSADQDQTGEADENESDSESSAGDTNSGPELLFEGEFQDRDRSHQGSGFARIYTQEGENILRLEDFEVTNGPGLEVVLSTNADPTPDADLGEGSVSLGALKGNRGNQNYEIPANVDISAYKSVVIYCRPFSIVFSYATL